MTAREMIEQEFSGKLGPQSIFGPDGNIRPGVIIAAERVIERLMRESDAAKKQADIQVESNRECCAEVEYIRYTFDWYYSDGDGTINMAVVQQDAIEEEWEREAHEMNATRIQAESNRECCAEVDRLRALLERTDGAIEAAMPHGATYPFCIMCGGEIAHTDDCIITAIRKELHKEV